MDTVTLDELETEHGTAILSDLTGQHLSRNQQSVRLFDESRKSAEYYFRSDEQGKPYIQDFQNGKRHYPVTAYSQIRGLDFNEAKESLIKEYYGHDGYTYQTSTHPPRTYTPPPPAPISYLPSDEYQRCRIQFERNGLFEYLRFKYGRESAVEVFTRYRLGTSRHWQYYGYLATCLPQFDIDGNLRQVKVIPFDAMNGKRIKNDQPAEIWSTKRERYQPTAPGDGKILFLGKRMAENAGMIQINLVSCFFGEHLLRLHPEKRVAIVEGETTAIECSIHYPEFAWLATGGKNGARWTDADTFGVLRDRDVTLWPDADAHEKWTEKAQPLRPLVRSLQVSDYVNRNAPAGSKADLRDLLTRPCYFPPDGMPMAFGEPVPVSVDTTAPAGHPSSTSSTSGPALCLVPSANRQLMEVLGRCMNLATDAVQLYRLSRVSP